MTRGPRPLLGRALAHDTQGILRDSWGWKKRAVGVEGHCHCAPAFYKRCRAAVAFPLHPVCCAMRKNRSRIPDAPAGIFPQPLGKSHHDASVKIPISSPSPKCRPGIVMRPVAAISYSLVLCMWALERAPVREVSCLMRASSIRTPIRMLPRVQTLGYSADHTWFPMWSAVGVGVRTISYTASGSCVDRAPRSP